MPTFFATTTKIHLSVSDLAASTTKELSTHANSATARKLQASVAGISSGEILAEQPLCCQDESHMRFLGEHEDMPFFMVQAGKNLFKNEVTQSSLRRQALKSLSRRAVSHASDDSDSTLTTIATMTTVNEGDTHVERNIEQGDMRFKKANRSSIPAKRSSSGRYVRQSTSPPGGRSSRASNVVTKPDNDTPAVPNSRLRSPFLPRQSPPRNTPIALALTQPEVVPRALSLIIVLSKESFAQSCRIGTKHVAQDVKIDIFFNGEMTASTYVPARYRGEANNVVQLTQRFSGRRVGRMLERPWVFVPPGQNADGSLRTSKRNKTAYVDAHGRWERIAKSLNNEGEIYGKNHRGDKSVIREYLASLAKLDMPTEVNDMQRGGGPGLGVIDVVLTLGRGQKDEPEGGYVKEPTRMRLLGFHHHGVGKERLKAIKVASAKPMKHNVESNVPDTSTSTGNHFAAPMAPSSANSAFRGRRSFASTGAILRSGSHAGSSQRSSLSTRIEKSLSTEQFNSAPMPKSSSLGCNLPLVPAGTPLPKFNAKLLVGSPHLLLDSPAFNGPSGISPAGASNGTRTGKTGALGDMNPAETGHVRRSSLRQRNSPSPNLRGMRISSDTSTVSSTQSSPSTVSRRQELKGTAVTSFNSSPSSTRKSKNTQPRKRSDDTEVSPDVVAAIRGTRSNAKRFRQRTRSGTTKDVTTKPTPNVPQKHYKGSTSVVLEAPQPRRTSSSNKWGVSDRLTLAEEMAQIEASSRKEISAAGAINASPDQLDPMDGSETPQKIVKLKLKGQLTAQMTPPSSFTNAEMPAGSNHNYPIRLRSSSMFNRAIHNNISNQPIVKPAPTSIPTPTPTPQPKARQKPPPATPATSQAQPHWPTPDLSQDSVLTYAEEPSWRIGPHSDRKNGAAGGNGGVFRQIKAERNGWFEESSILMGVRFLVG